MKVETERQSPKSVPGRAKTATVTKKRALVVDDEPDVAHKAKALLRRAGPHFAP